MKRQFANVYANALSENVRNYEQMKKICMDVKIEYRTFIMLECCII